MGRADWTDLALEAEKAMSHIHQLAHACRMLPKKHSVPLPALLDITRQLSGNRKEQKEPPASRNTVSITMSSNLSLRMS